MSFRDQKDTGPEEHADMKLMRCLHRPSSRTVMNRKVGGVLVVTGLLFGAASLWAHHGNAAFDMTNTVRMQGTVTDFQWIKRHALIHADLKEEQGKVENRKLEIGRVARLSRVAWSEKRGQRAR